MKVAALAGGVGGARLADGLAQNLPPEDLTVIVNVGDDFDYFGLHICPDLDTVCYTLAGLSNPATGWGLVGETWNALENIGLLGGPTWFRLGDRDLGTHLERTRRLAKGEKLSQITGDFCRGWGIKLTVLPASDDSVLTWVYTDEGEVPFQEYFVHRQCRPRVSGFRFAGAEQSSPAEGVLEAIQQADMVVICPSNPWVSVDPILAIPGILPAVMARPVVAVSPIIGGRTVKGPAAKMYAEMGIEPSALSVARHYRNFLSGFVLDQEDAALESEVQALGVSTRVTATWMHTSADRRQLAADCLTFGGSIRK
jgi:LPPG:FO 2-phospho-L-lactate transferase